MLVVPQGVRLECFSLYRTRTISYYVGEGRAQKAENRQGNLPSGMEQSWDPGGGPMFHAVCYKCGVAIAHPTVGIEPLSEADYARNMSRSRYSHRYYCDRDIFRA